MNCSNCNLKQGSTGADVRTLETFLYNKKNSKGVRYYTGRIDASFGPILKKSVKAWQRDNGLSDDGWFGPKSCNKSGLGTVTPTPTKTKTTVSTITKGTIQTAIESKLGTFTNFTQFYNKMIGRGYSHYVNDIKTLAQEEQAVANLNCADASQLGYNLAKEMGYSVRFVHLKCKKSGEGHIVLQINGKEFTSWTWVDLAAAMSVGSKYAIGKAWCQDGTVLSYNDQWLLSDDGKT